MNTQDQRLATADDVTRAAWRQAVRIDSDACRDADLLAAEVRRLRAVIAAGEPVLTDEEREAVAYFSCVVDSKYASTLRGLLERQTNLSAGQAPAR